MVTRRQASLFLSGVANLERWRKCYNPIQAQLIPAHVTLCRDEDVPDWNAFEARLEAISPFELTLEFGTPCRDGNFVFLPVTSGAADFQRLREALLSESPRPVIPHLTIVHPRNGECDDRAFARLVGDIAPFRYTFQKVMLIQQQDGGIWSSLVSGPSPTSTR